jgi:hypothetical protein
MPEEKKKGCVESAAGPLAAEERASVPAAAPARPALPMVATIGKEAPDFEAVAYRKGEFSTVRLSGYRPKWVVLCFYPAAFTFV